MMKRVVACALAVTMIIVAATAWAYWSADSVAGGNAAAGATTVNQGATPTGNAVGTTVTVSWTATTLANGQAVGGYLVKRYDAGTNALQTILSACTGTITALSCVESSVPVGSWKYAVTPVIGTNWVGAESAKSTTVVVETTAPANAITLSGITGGAFKSANTIYYRGVASGSFALTNAVTDAGSGPASSQTAALGGTTTGWTHTPSTVTTPAGGPYVSNSFSWTPGTTSGPTELVTGRDVAGNSVGTTLTFADDSTAPSAGTVSYPSGVQSGRSVPVTFTTGTDGGSGIATRQLQRQSATLTGGVCGSYSGFANIGPDTPTSVYTDAAVTNGTCYKYQYVVTDAVGNQHIATSATVAMIDYAGAVNATTGLLSHWRLGEGSATLTASDSFNRTAASSLTGSTAEIGGTWAFQVGSADTERISSEFRARRNGTGYAVNYSNATPASADYSVEADLYVKSFNTDDVAGVIGRLNTGTGAFYMARWETDNTWNIVQWSGGTPTWIDTSAVQANLTAGQTYRVRLELSGAATTTLSLYVNGVLLATGTDTTAPFTAAGKAGIMDGEPSGTFSKSDAAGIHFENFQVTPSTYPRAADSKGSNTGDYKNGPTLGATGALVGDANTAAGFDGVNDHVQVTNSTGIPVGASTRSVEAWFKTSSAARQVLFHYGSRVDTQEFGLWLDAGGTTMTAWGFGGAHDKVFTLPAAVNDGNWHQVVQTYSGTVLVLYIDGVALASQTATRATVMNMYGFGIGAVIDPSDTNSGGFFTGSLDEVSFYTTVLSQTTVTDHYLLGTATVPEPVVHTTVADLAYLENGTTAVDDLLTVGDGDSANLTSATVDMTTNYVNGEDTLAFTNQNGITGTWTASTGIMALSGSATVAQYQAALRSITYNNNSDYPNTSTRTVTFAVSDGTNNSNTASRNVTVTAVNDAPSGTSGTLTFNEDATYTFATADFGMSDPVDNGAHSLLAVKMTTLPAAGLLKLSGTNVTLGQFVTAANITSGLLTYVPAAEANGTGYSSFTFQVQDNGGTANSGVDLDASANTITFNVTALNDAPVNTIPGTQATDINTPKVFSSGNGNLISVADVDAATVQVQLVSTNGATTLFGTMPGSLTFTVGDGTADATMTFSGTKAAVNTALDGLSFNPTTSFTGTASLQIVTSDLGATGTGGTLTDDDTVNITVTASARPVVTATVANLNYNEDTAVVLDSGITVTDADSNITGATISMTTNYVNGEDTLNFNTQNGITGNWVAGTGVLTLSGSATPANYQTALRSIGYTNSSQNPTANNRNVNFVVSDAIGASNTSSRQVAVTAVNDAPVNTMPGTQATNMNTAKVFSSGNSNVISVADVDAATVQVQLVSTNGATTLFGTMPGSLTFTVGDGTADATMTFSGTKAAVNTALDGLSFNPTTSFTGTASLQVVTSDLGATGTGGTLTDNDTVNITVSSAAAYFDAVWAQATLISYFRLAETSGTAADDLKSATNGTYTNTPTLNQGSATNETADRSVTFNGTNEYMSFTKPATMGANWTVQFWFKSTQGTTNIDENQEWTNYAGMVDGNISGTNTDFGITLSAGGVIHAGVGGSPGDVTIKTAAGGYNDGNWHYVVFTRAGTAMTLYVDNATAVTGTGPNATATSTPTIFLGRSAAGGTIRYYAGSIDEVAIYSTAISGATVAAHYAAR